jgi:ABC-2 type transport system ATP-binding protein
MIRREESGGHPGPALRATGLVKSYGDLVAVDGVDLCVPAGTCLGVLGPNGAGKTTTIEMLEGLTTPDAGEIEILGWTWEDHPREIREAIGVQLQETNLQDKLTTREILRLFRSFYDEGEDLDDILELVGLREKADTQSDKLSGGQRQRLAVGCALLSRPRILFLDEPTTGLDPQARRRVWEVVEAFKARGGTVILTTHYMEEAERLADDLVIVDRGRVIQRGSPASIVSSLGAEGVVEFVAAGGRRLSEEALGGLSGVEAVLFDGDTVRLTVSNTQSAIGALFERCRAEDLEVENLHTHRPTLEDVFVILTGKHLRDE